MRPLALALASLALFSGLAACGDPPAATAPARAPTSGAKSQGACPARVDAPLSDIARADAVVGRKVSAVCVLGVSADVQKTVIAALGTKEGEKLDVERVHDDLASLAKLRPIENAAVYAIERDQDVVVVYALEQRPSVGEVVFEGAHALGAEFSGKVSLLEQRPFVRAEGHMLVQLLREEYARRGYGGAKVHTRLEPMTPGKVRVRVVVTEGVVWKLLPPKFHGASKITAPELEKAADLGTTYDPAKIERASLNITRLYYDRGMVHAHVGFPIIGPPAADGGVVATFEVSEGDVFRVARVSVANATKADERALGKIIKTKGKDIFSRSAVEEDVKKVRAFYGDKGRAVEVTPVTKLDANKHTIDITLEVAEAKKAP